MKKMIVIMLAALMMCGLSACGESEPEHTIAFVEGKFISVPINDESWETVAIYTQYTNSSEESAIPADWVNVKTYQHGIELPVYVRTGEKMDGYIQCDTSVQSGVTADVVWTFRREDNSPVSVEFSDDQTFTVEG